MMIAWMNVQMALLSLLSGDFFGALNNAINNAMTALLFIAPAVAGIAWVIAKLWQMIIPEQQGRAEPREWARNALVTYVAILVGAKLISWLGSIFGA